MRLQRWAMVGLVMAMFCFRDIRAAGAASADVPSANAADLEAREIARIRGALDNAVRYQWPKELGPIDDARAKQIVDSLIGKMQGIAKEFREQQDRLKREMPMPPAQNKEARKEYGRLWRAKMGELMKVRRSAEDAVVPDAIAAALTPTEKARVAGGRHQFVADVVARELAAYRRLPTAIQLTGEQRSKLAPWLQDATQRIAASHADEVRFRQGPPPGTDASVLSKFEAERRFCLEDLDRKVASLLTWDQNQKWQELKQTGSVAKAPRVDPRIRKAVVGGARSGRVPAGFYVDMRVWTNTSRPQKSRVASCRYRLTSNKVVIVPQSAAGKECPALEATFRDVRELCAALLAKEEGLPTQADKMDILSYVENYNRGTFPPALQWQSGGSVIADLAIGVGNTEIRTRTDLCEPQAAPHDAFMKLQRIAASVVAEALLADIAAGRPAVDGFVVRLRKDGGHGGSVEGYSIGDENRNLRKAAQTLKQGGFARLVKAPASQFMDFSGPTVSIAVHAFEAVCGGSRNWPIARPDAEAVSKLYDNLRPLVAK